MDAERAREVVELYKPEMIDLSHDDVVPERFDFVQPKMDGWWTFLEIRNKVAVVVTSGGEIKHSFHVDFPDSDLVAEWIHGTNWAQTSPDRKSTRLNSSHP
jgi:hypothetical protein